MPVCNTCSCTQPLNITLRMAFQPIVDAVEGKVFAYEALVRGEQGESAASVFTQINSDNMYAFDQCCRVLAIETMAKLNRQATVSINFLPNAIYEPETCLARTLHAASKFDFPREQIIFEVTEHEKIENHQLLTDVFHTYRAKGFRTAIDDFGEGFAGLNLLADFQPHFLKLDMKLVQGISENRVKQSILSGIQVTAQQLGIELIAEGIETREDYLYLKYNRVRYMQGYYIARPALEALPEIDFATL